MRRSSRRRKPDAAGGPVIGEACVDAGLPEAIDVTGGRRDERDVDSPRDRMLLVGLRESEVPPDRQAGRARGLLDLELVEHRREGVAGNR
jgi:hypothetical protein